jgi:hypothetical protein
MPASRSGLDTLRTAAMTAAIIGAVGAVGLMLSVGKRNASIAFLIAMFVVWDASPFGGLAIAIWKSARWPANIRAALYLITLIVTVASLAIYAAAVLRPARPTPVFLFLMVPLVSWVFLGAAALALRKARG